jgi:RNA polymerase sigma-70 factor (ECF subfamily)
MHASVDPRTILSLSLALIRADSGAPSSGPDVEALVERHHRYLLALLEYKTGDPELALDLLQDTYLSFLNAALAGGAASRWSDDAKVRNYLITIALNKVRDHSRSARRRAGTLVKFRTNEEMESWLESAASSEPSAEAVLAAEGEERRLGSLSRLAMERLPDRDRTILFLKFTRELDNPSIAAEMGIGIKAAESLLFRAKRRFRDEFERLRGESE